MEGIKSIVLSLIENGIFGKVVFESLCSDNGSEVGAQFASSLMFLNLTVDSSSGSKQFPLVVKLAFQDPEMRELRNSAGMFYNEVTMYKEVLPSLGVDESVCPKLFYGVTSAGADSASDILILENLKQKNYELSRIKLFLDNSHIEVAVKQIAKFHSLSYVMKYENRDEFFRLTHKIKTADLPETAKLEFNNTNLAGIVRGMKPFLNGNKDNGILGKCLELLQNPSDVRDMLASPEEPFAVICHGDFCNNNVLYKYDKAGIPIACALFDFQLSQYASPATDLFFFLYMHTTSEFRVKHWDEVLKLYYDSLRHNIPNHITIPDFQQYLNHFSKRAIFGYTICSWFLPMLMDKNPISDEEFSKLDREGKNEYFSKMGGDEAQKVISEVVLHMLDNGYIKEFVEFCGRNNVQ